jgi:hypothetical protein
MRTLATRGHASEFLAFLLKFSEQGLISAFTSCSREWGLIASPPRGLSGYTLDVATLFGSRGP